MMPNLAKTVNKWSKLPGAAPARHVIWPLLSPVYMTGSQKFDRKDSLVVFSHMISFLHLS
jgi:hypothetical protein